MPARRLRAPTDPVTALSALRPRPAIPADAAGVMVLHASVVAEGRWLLASPDEPAPSLEHWRARIADPRGVCLVLALGPRVLGWAQILPGPYRRVLHVGHLEVYLGLEARGGGHGRLLLEAALSAAGAHPTLEKVSLSVRADNTRAIHLYEALGFVLEGRRRGEIREGELRLDDLLMARWLRSETGLAF